MKLNRFRPFGNHKKSSTRQPAKPKLRFFLGALACLLLGLVASLYVFFPASALEERIEYEVKGRTPVEADLRALSLGFPPAIRAEKLTLNIEEPQPYSFTFDNTAIKPLWHSLFLGNPGVAIHTDILGGQGEGTIHKNGAVELSLARLLFNTPLPSLTSLHLSGTLAKGTFSGEVPAKRTTESQLQAQLEKVMISGLKSIGIAGDTLSLGTITLQGSGRGNSFKIEQFDTSGGDIKLSGGGTVLLGRTVEQSRLNLNVALSPEQSLDKGIADLLSLFKQPARDGSYRFRITGTVAAPVIK